MPLSPHQVIAEEPELDAAPGVDDVVDTAMERVETAEKRAVGGIYNCIGFQCRDVALP